MREPVGGAFLVKELISSGLKLLVILQLFVFSDVQLAAILLFVDNALAVIAWIWARAQVTPIRSPMLVAGTPVTTPEGATAIVRKQ